MMMRTATTRWRLVVLAAVGWGCGLNAGGIAAGDAGDAEGGPPLCGNGRVEGAEECDDGNRVPGDGCESSCLFSCHRDDECDDGDQCTRDACQTLGAGKDCMNVFVPGLACTDGNPCTRDSEDHCELTDGGIARCVGGTNECICDRDEECRPFEDGNLCNGTLACVDRHCEIDSATVVVCDSTRDTTCRRNTCDPATGACDMVPQGDGILCDDGRFCTLEDRCSGTECVGRGDRCTYPCQTCNESMFTCDLDPGFCIIGDACIPEFNPSSPDPRALNPANRCQGCLPSVDPYGWSNLPFGVGCDDGLWCNGLETCDGRGTCSPGIWPCPIGGCINGCDEGTDACVPEPNTTECRRSAGPCDPAEYCDGTSLACPGDLLRPNSYECRPSAGPCDRPETCDGRNPACPPDQFRSSSFECRAAAGPCDVAETCTGSSAACPTDVFRPAGHECRAAAGLCDVPEVCAGGTAACPTDAFRPAGYECRAAAGLCDVPEVCAGGTAACPRDAFRPAGYECRAAAGLCDVPETCAGGTAACPTDGFRSAGYECRAAAGLCDVPEVCAGGTAACPTDGFRSAGYVCRPATEPCDVPEVCAGGTAACPPDAGAPDNSACSGGICCAGTCRTGWNCCNDEPCRADPRTDRCDSTTPRTCVCGSTGGPCAAATPHCCRSGPDTGTCVAAATACRP